LSAPDILFKGIPRGRTRGYTNRAIQAWVAAQAGVLPGDVVCGDVSLYSTALGKALTDEDWRLECYEELPIKGLAAIISPLLTDPVSKATAVLFALRVLQYQRKKQKVFHRDLQRELIINAEHYLAQLRLQVEWYRNELRGITYLPQDMWITLDQCRDQAGRSGFDEV
jgi:hypothetical protein